MLTLYVLRTHVVQLSLSEGGGSDHTVTWCLCLFFKMNKTLEVEMFNMTCSILTQIQTSTFLRCIDTSSVFSTNI